MPRMKEMHNRENNAESEPLLLSAPAAAKMLRISERHPYEPEDRLRNVNERLRQVRPVRGPGCDG